MPDHLGHAIGSRSMRMLSSMRGDGLRRLTLSGVLARWRHYAGSDRLSMALWVPSEGSASSRPYDRRISQWQWLAHANSARWASTSHGRWLMRVRRGLDSIGVRTWKTRRS